MLGGRPVPVGGPSTPSGAHRRQRGVGSDYYGFFCREGPAPMSGRRVSPGDVVKEGVLYAARTHRGIDRARPPDDVETTFGRDV